MEKKHKKTTKSAKDAESGSKSHASEKVKTDKNYVFSVGRRKTATASLRLVADGTGNIRVNDRDLQDYFPTEQLRQSVTAPLLVLGLEKKIDATAILSGGGTVAQAKALSLALARALVKTDETRKTVLKKQGLLTRDARKKERKKPGLKRARRAPQWQKR